MALIGKARVGGNIHQTFPGALEQYPIKNEALWTPGVLDDSMLPEGWHFAYDASVPTCRLLNEPYNPASENTQYYAVSYTHLTLPTT